eukprot:3310473-Prymnesium_polylepis.1
MDVSFLPWRASLARSGQQRCRQAGNAMLDGRWGRGAWAARPTRAPDARSGCLRSPLAPRRGVARLRVPFRKRNAVQLGLK